MPKIATVGDGIYHGSQKGVLAVGSLISDCNGRKIVRGGDICVCSTHGTTMVNSATCSTVAFDDGKPIAVEGSATMCGALILNCIAVHTAEL